MAKIIVKQEGKADVEYPVKDRTTIGRRRTNDIVLNENLCSREHAEILKSGGTYKVRDLGSHNGTLLNGVKIDETILKEGDIINIGATQLCFEKSPIDQMLGERIAGYKILERLGEGGMGKVYKARQISMDREVALKVLSLEVTRDENYIRAFILEAKVAGQLNHNNVVNVHDFGKTDEGTYYLSMEFVDGENIQEILDKQGKLSTSQSTIIISQVSSALGYAHRHSIIHSDIKPQNILLDRNGNVKLADLGLAKYFGKGSFDHDPDIVMGTPFYMSPEQATKGKIDARTDIYSLGATFFHMITGRPPFDGDSALTILTKHVTEPVPSPRKYDVTISPQIADLIKWMMEKSPDDRPASIAELEKRLNTIKEQEKHKTAERTARSRYAADVKQSMASRRLRTRRKHVLGQAVGLMITAAVIVVALLVIGKKIGQSEGGPVPAVTAVQTPAVPTPAAAAPPPVTVASEPAPVPPAVTPAAAGDPDSVVLDFTDLGQKTMLTSLSEQGWEGWSFDIIRGYLESPGDQSCGFRYMPGTFRSDAFTAEIDAVFGGDQGAFSFSLDGDAQIQTSGFHFNPEEIILFCPGGQQRIAFKRPADKHCIVGLRLLSNGEAILYLDGTEAGRAKSRLAGFEARLVVKIDGVKVQVHSLKLKRSS